MRRLATAVVTALALPLHAQRPARDTLAARVDSLAERFVRETHVPGMSVAVVHGNDTITMKGYGTADLTKHIAAGAHTIYRIGSITKQFTAAEIMRQVERGTLSLDDDVAKILPDVPLHGNHVAIRQLLNHTSGIPDYSAYAQQAGMTRELTPRQIVALVEDAPFDFAPGSAWSYSNTGYTLLAMVLEKITGEPYASLMQRDLFAPLGLTQTRYCPTSSTDTLFATGYALANGGVAPAQPINMSQYVGSGGLCSTVGDLVRWQRALVGGQVVSARSYELMTTPDTLNDGRRLTYGFGLGPGELAGHAALGHGGDLSGFVAKEMFFPADRLNIAIFANAPVDLGPLAGNIARMALGLTPVGANPTLSAADRDLVVGTYEFASSRPGSVVLRVEWGDGRLTAHNDNWGSESVPLIYVGDLVFGTAADRSVRLSLDGSGGALLFDDGVVVSGRKK
ncbi:MAG TPA: serine hydrolase domain-containing protein [Gemmatimonadaceae bacterium]|jgi:CubicO group peptidase (beta-lactamase class C family)